MATVTHTIYSHYNSEDREILERLTGQASQDNLDDVDREWQAESSLAAQRRTRAAPNFVCASQQYDPWNLGTLPSGSQPRVESDAGDSVASWYRSVRQEQCSADSQKNVSEESRQDYSNRPITTSSTAGELVTSSRKFPPSSTHVHSSSPRERPSSSPPTLAEILQREPPPLAHEPQFRPPAWVAIGPSNKGFTMLQRSGWNEGEPLGPDVIRQQRTIENIIRANGDFIASAARKSRTSFSQPSSNSPKSGLNHQTNVIDLTLSDSESDSDIQEVSLQAQDIEMSSPSNDDELTDNASSSSTHTHTPVDVVNEPGCHRTALLTPIATVLKADRLGIGLKAKTAGPYRGSKKRITHNEAALKAHMRAAEEMKRRKREFGHGRRGFDRANKREMESRQHMLAYLNS